MSKNVKAMIWPEDSLSLSYVIHCRSGEPRFGGTSGKPNVFAQCVFVSELIEQAVQFVEIPSMLEMESKLSTFRVAHLRPAVSKIYASCVSDIRKLLSK